jgi:HEAT repeat protein
MNQDDSTPKSRLPRWGLIATAIFLVVIVAGLMGWLWFSSGVDPYKVNGLPFREFLARNPGFQLEEPLAALGTNALPHLIRIVARRPEPLRVYKTKLKLWNLLPRAIQARYPELYPVPGLQIQRTALFGLRFFGPEAKAALPEVIRVARAETNLMLRASAMVAALNIAPQSPETFALWRDEWEHTNHLSRRDLGSYLHMPETPIPAATPYLLEEAADKQSALRRPAIEAFEFFGEAARPAVPYLAEMFGDGSANGRTSFGVDLTDILIRLGPIAAKAVPALAACLKEQRIATAGAEGAIAPPGYSDGLNTMARTLEALKAIGPDARSALPEIAPLLSSPDPTIRMLAAATQARITGQIDEALPILLAGVEMRWSGTPRAHVMVRPAVACSGQQAAALLLGELGPPAKEAVSGLEGMLADPSEWTRIIAAQALWRITKNADKALPVLLDLLPAANARPVVGSPDRRLLYCIDAIAEMGPAAPSAIPILERVRTYSMTARRAANVAIERIQSERGL